MTCHCERTGLNEATLSQGTFRVPNAMRSSKQPKQTPKQNWRESCAVFQCQREGGGMGLSVGLFLSQRGSAEFSVGPYGHQSGTISLVPGGSTGLPPFQPRIPSAQSGSRGIRLKVGERPVSPRPLIGRSWGPRRADPCPTAPEGSVRHGALLGGG